MRAASNACASRWSASTRTYVDSYKSVQEALIHGGIANDVGVDITWISSDLFTDQAARARDPRRRATACSCRADSACAASKGWSKPCVPRARRGLPFFGICLGMQVAIIEFARNMCGLDDSQLERVRARVLESR